MQTIYQSPGERRILPAINCLRNGVLLYNTLSAPKTVCGAIQSHTGLSFHPITDNKVAQVTSLLLWFNRLIQYKLCERWKPVQDAMALPGAICPSESAKLFDGGYRLMKLILPVLTLARGFIDRKAVEKSYGPRGHIDYWRAATNYS